MEVIKIKLALYIRVSSEEQKKEGLSMEAQKEKLIKYAELKDYEIYETYVDGGISGTKIKPRHAFQEVLIGAEQHKFDAMVVTKLDRAFRNTKEALSVLDKFKKWKIEFISLSESIDTSSAMGVFFFTIMSAIAQLEAQQTGERLSSIHSSKFENGIIVGKAPYGYRFNKKNKLFFPAKKKADIVKDAYKMYLGGKNIPQISKKHKVDSKTIWRVLSNKTYAGVVIYRGKEKQGVHEPLIALEDYQKVQLMLENNKKKDWRSQISSSHLSV